MRFLNRSSLGIQLAKELQYLRGKEAVVVCVTQSALMTAISVASEIRAWVYPLVYAPVFTSNGLHRVAGVINHSGVYTQLTPNSLSEEKERLLAEHDVGRQLELVGMMPDEGVLLGRAVILVGDSIIDPLPLQVAGEVIRNVRPASIAVALGNASVAVAEQARNLADTVIIKDILSGILLDNGKYFEQVDEYDIEQQYELVRNIATYWR